MNFQHPSSRVPLQDKNPPWGGNAEQDKREEMLSRIRAEQDRTTETWKSEGSDKNGRGKPRNLRKPSI